MDNYDLTKAKISQQHIAARLNQGPRDENGRFRITKGMSSLVTPEEIAAKKEGVTLMDPTKAVTLHTEKKRPADWKRDIGGRDEKKPKAEKEEMEEPAVKPTWLSVGLVVKILDKSQAEAYKRKGVIRSVKQEKVNTASVELLGDDVKMTVTVRRSTWRRFYRLWASRFGWSRANPPVQLASFASCTRSDSSRRWPSTRRTACGNGWNFFSTTRCASSTAKCLGVVFNVVDIIRYRQ